MAEIDIFQTINDLSEQEEQLYASAGDGGGLNAAERDRLEAIRIELDRCYDLLHQRQARLAAGQDPDAAQARTAEIVEGYEQ